jgi:hypothetical protein
MMILMGMSAVHRNSDPGSNYGVIDRNAGPVFRYGVVRGVVCETRE